MKQQVRKVSASYYFDDDNGGLVFGLEDKNEPCDYTEWFSTEKERNGCVKNNNMVVVE
jgi:hypothetical protein